MADRAAVLDALGDPTRRRVLELLRTGERSVRELTDASSVTQPAVSQHLRVLRDAGLVTVRPEGTRRLYRVDPDGLGAVRAWVDSFWDVALTAFAAHVEAGASGTGPVAPAGRAATSEVAVGGGSVGADATAVSRSRTDGVR